MIVLISLLPLSMHAIDRTYTGELSPSRLWCRFGFFYEGVKMSMKDCKCEACMKELKKGDWIKIGTAMGKVIEIEKSHVIVRTLIEFEWLLSEMEGTG